MLRGRWCGSPGAQSLCLMLLPVQAEVAQALSRPQRGRSDHASSGHICVGVLVPNPPAQSLGRDVLETEVGLGRAWNQHSTHCTQRNEERGGRERWGCRWGLWGRESIKIPLPLTVSWWEDGGGMSLSLPCPCHPLLCWRDALQPAVVLKRKVHGGQGVDDLPATEIVAAPSYAAPWGCCWHWWNQMWLERGGVRGWLGRNARTVGRPMGSAPQPGLGLLT